jgi:hypothetical protein
VLDDMSAVERLRVDPAAHPIHQHRGVQLVRARLPEHPPRVPLGQPEDQRAQVLAGRGRVVVAVGVGDQTMSLQLVQPLGQQRARHLGQAAGQLVEARGAYQQVPDAPASAPT